MEKIPSWFWEYSAAIALAFLVLLFVWGALKILGSELHHFRAALGSEIIEGFKGAKTVGALNWYQFLVVALVGIVVIVASTGQKVFGIALVKLIGTKKAEELAKYSDYNILVFVLAILMVISLVCVVIDNRRRLGK